jgi:hypothetical protein
MKDHGGTQFILLPVKGLFIGQERDSFKIGSSQRTILLFTVPNKVLQLLIGCTLRPTTLSGDLWRNHHIC